MQSQYRNYQQPPQRSPHGATPRRGPGPMVGAHTHGVTPAQIQAQRQQQALEAEAAKRRAKKPTDRNIPAGAEEIVIGDSVKQYQDLRKTEKRLDAIMTRKRMELLDVKTPATDKMRRMRIWISNTADNQPWQGRGLDENAFDFSTGTESTYKVKIEGRLLDDDKGENLSEIDEQDGDGHTRLDDDAMDQDGQDKASKEVASRPSRKLSSFFKSITVEYDRAKNLQSDGVTLIEWKKPQIPPGMSEPPATANFDTLEFERKSDENINCTINLFRDDVPERFALSRELAELIDREDGSRETIITGIWDYAKAMGLEQDEEKRLIQCDDRLRQIFRSETIVFPQMPELIASHLAPLPPLKLPYTIRVDPEYQASPIPTVYDILVTVENPLRAQKHAIASNLSNLATLSRISNLDDQLAVLVQAINQSKSKHSFMIAMGKDPKRFVKKWVSSQKWDMDIITGESLKGGGNILTEEFRRGGADGVWGSQSVRESVGLMVAKK